MTCLIILISEATDREKSTDIRAEGRFKSWGQKTDEKVPVEACIDKKTDRKGGIKAGSVKRHMRTLITESPAGIRNCIPRNTCGHTAVPLAYSIANFVSALK